jgi:glutathione S-transferase
MKLYTARLAPNPRRVTMFLAEKGLSDTVERVEMDLATDTKTDEHLARHPLGLLPVLELDDGTHLSESRAICSYLEAVHPEPNLMGYSPEERAFIEMFDRRVEFALLAPVAGWVRHGHPGLARLEPVQIEAYAELSGKKAQAAAEWLDADLSHRAYIAGNRFTIADITAFCALEFGRIVKFKPWEHHAHIARWREAILARPSAQAA